MELHYDNPHEIQGKTPTLECAERLYGLRKLAYMASNATYIPK